MYATVSSLKGIIKIKDIVTDNAAFKLHYQITSLILMLFSVTVTTNQYFGDPIDCFVTMKDELPEKILDNYCWVQSTFTLPGARNRRVGEEVIYPGVDKALPDDERVYHSYYQWVCFFLFLQAALFYLPHYAWKLLEGKKIQRIVLSLQGPVVNSQELEVLKGYLTESRNQHTQYAVKYALCEALNVINVIGQIYCTDVFLGGEFTTYGIEVVQFSRMDQANRTDPMIKVFPRLTKCTFNKYGVAGSIQQHSALCVLPINIFNEKIFIFLWFWFIVIAIISCLAVVARLLLLCFRSLRYYDTVSNCPYADKKKLWAIIEEWNYGDWFLLHLLSKNMGSLNFSALLQSLVHPSDKNHETDESKKLLPHKDQV